MNNHVSQISHLTLVFSCVYIYIYTHNDRDLPWYYTYRLLSKELYILIFLKKFTLTFSIFVHKVMNRQENFEKLIQFLLSLALDAPSIHKFAPKSQLYTNLGSKADINLSSPFTNAKHNQFSNGSIPICT